MSLNYDFIFQMQFLFQYTCFSEQATIYGSWLLQGPVSILMMNLIPVNQTQAVLNCIQSKNIYTSWEIIGLFCEPNKTIRLVHRIV